MSASTSSNINDSFEKPLPKVRKTVNENTEETNLVTKNLKIFPSLHPLSNHYRVKTDPTSRPTVVRNINSEVEETKKKIKVNDNTEIVVKNESTQSNIPQIPTKPIKIWETKKPVNKIVQDEPLSMDDPLVNMAKALQALQEQQKMQAQRQVFLQRKMMIQQLTQKAAQYTAMLNAIKSQENLLMMNNDSQDLPNFEVNDISTQLIPNITHLMKICQENQQKLFMAVGNQMANQARFQRGMNVNPYGTQSFQFA